VKPHLTRILCPICSQNIEAAKLTKLGVDLDALLESLPIPFRPGSAYLELARKLGEHQEGHKCCARGHDCEASLPARKPDWWWW
jgi:hypothetical protein